MLLSIYKLSIVGVHFAQISFGGVPFATWGTLREAMMIAFKKFRLLLALFAGRYLAQSIGGGTFVHVRH